MTESHHTTVLNNSSYFIYHSEVFYKPQKSFFSPFCFQVSETVIMWIILISVTKREIDALSRVKISKINL